MQIPLFPTPPPPVSQPSILSIKDGLNAPQYEAVSTVDGPVLVVAGAGSGKTRTLVYRVAHLIQQGVSPEKILLLTFTRKSAQEMLDRAVQILDDSCSQVVGGTFHAVASSILRRHGYHLGYTPQFTILDRGDSEGIVNLLKSSLDLSGVGKRFPSKRVVINILSQVVNKRKSLSEIIQDRYWHLEEYEDDLQLINKHYVNFKLEHNLMDYDDLLVNLQKVLQIPEAAEAISGRFSHIMVDEYQDTNKVQAEIISLLARNHKNVMVVGDDSQSIYSFRGADFRNIMEFPDQFSGTKVIRLEENYRSTQPILTLTNAIIENAAEKYTKKLFTSIPGNDKPLIYSARNDAEQASFIGRKISDYVKSGGSLNEVAVLFRSGFHSYKLELELANRQLVFEKRGGLKLTESAHIKDVVSFFKLVFNPLDTLAWNRLLLMLEKVGPKTAQKIVDSVKNTDDPISAMAAYPAVGKWKQGFIDLLTTLDDLRKLYTPLEQYDRLMAYYQDVFERIYHDDYPNRSRDLEQLKEIIASYKDVESFLNDTALDPPELIKEERRAALHNEGRMVLSTVHSAKGLEWDLVFIIHLVEGKFPSGMAQTSDEVEEERRLLYVAATRARKTLYLLYPREIAAPGRYGEPSIISRFLEELPPGLMVTANKTVKIDSEFTYGARPVTKKASVGTRGRLENNESKAGTKIKHPFFGEGHINKQVGPRTVEVFFNRHGVKTINLDYVKMEIV